MQATRQRARITPALIGLFLLCAGMLGMALTPETRAQGAGRDVYVVDISGTIDLGLAPYLERVLDDASSANAAAVVLDINTPGGRLDAALQMRDSLLGADVPTIAWVNRDAFSAGALIAIAAESIYMAPGAQMGAATPVDGAGETADEKIISAVRATFRATAEQRGRDPLIAEAMVDPAIAVEGLSPEGKLITLTTNEALEWGYADARAASIEEVLAAAGIEGANVIETSPGWAEAIVRFLTDPVVASMLFSFGFLLILADVFSGGIGLLAGAGVAMIALFFWGHFIVGLAGWEGVVLVLLGLALIAAEVFVIPGFGIFGIAGIIALLGGLYLSARGQDFVTEDDANRALAMVAGGFAVMVFGTALILFLLPKASRFQSLVLTAQVDVPAPPPQRRKRDFRRLFRSPAPDDTLKQSEPLPADREKARISLVGMRGVAASDLRPGGIGMFHGERIDVVTEGDYVRAGEPIEIVLDERYRRVVRRVEANGTPSESQ